MEVVEGDLRSLDDVRRAVQGVDAVYHVAAAFGAPYDNLQYLNVNGMGTLDILESIRSDVPNLHRLVYASTEARALVILNDAPQRPQTLRRHSG